MDKVVKLVGGGSVINGPTPSSFIFCEPYVLPMTGLIKKKVRREIALCIS